MRGVFERPAASGVWWVNYYVNGTQHREKVGRKGDAIALYQKRKADARAGLKLPDLKRTATVTVGDLIDLALEYVQADHKDQRNYVSKGAIVRKDLGALPASDLTPQELDRWLRKHCKSAATANRYKAFISLCYREGLRNGKVGINPARLVRHRREPAGRLRFLSHEEYDRLLAVIQERFPEHVAEFAFSVHTGARLSEQYSLAWSGVDLERRVARTVKAKSDRRTTQGRTIHLNEAAIGAMKSLKHHAQKKTDPVFPREGSHGRFDTRSWFQPCLEEAGIEEYVWHSNRHTFCSWLAMAGASIKEIQELAGHKTITMSARYAHLSPEHRLSVVDSIMRRPVSGTQQAPEQAPDRRKATISVA